MTDVKAILARLQNGESADDIANEFANMINDAVKLNDAEVQKQKEAEAAAAREESLNAKRSGNGSCAVHLGHNAVTIYVSMHKLVLIHTHLFAVRKESFLK